MIVDCDGCALRGEGCHDCVISVLIGLPPEVAPRPVPVEPQVAVPLTIDALAVAAALPRLRLVPIESLLPPGGERSAEVGERGERRVG